MRPILSESSLAGYTARQLSHFFPDGTPLRDFQRALRSALPQVLPRLARIAVVSRPPMFHRGDEVIFDHLFSDQYAMYLYLLAREVGVHLGQPEVATKLYLLNKALHAIDAYYEIELPDIFTFMHPVGTVLGRAVYGERLVVMQNCTVGNVRDIYPVIGSEVTLCAGAMVLGATQLGDGVTVGAGAMIIGRKVPAGVTVVGRGASVTYTQSGRPPMSREFYF